MPNAASYTVPDNPADPEAAALDLIERLPADILHTGAFTEVLQDYCSVPHADGAFAGLEWADARQIAAAVSWDVISHRISAAQAVECTNDGLGCTIIHDVFNNDDEYVAPMETLPCPITIAWAEKDTLLPVEPYGNITRERLPPRDLHHPARRRACAHARRPQVGGAHHPRRHRRSEEVVPTAPNVKLVSVSQRASS